MFRIIDERDVPDIRPYRISVEAGGCLTPGAATVRKGILDRIEDLKATALNGCLLDFIDELELRAGSDPDLEGAKVKIKGTHPSYGGQYLQMNFHPEIDHQFKQIWQDRYRWKDSEESYEDAVVITEAVDPGWWIVRLTRGPNISTEWVPMEAKPQSNPEKYLGVRRGWWEVYQGLRRIGTSLAGNPQKGK